MAIKLSSLAFLRRIPTRVSSNASLSSLSCANTVYVDPETDQNPRNSSEFESKIQFLRNKLHPDSLVHVLYSTSDVNSSLKLFKWASLQKKFKHNVDTYYLMILKLGMAGNVEEMEVFCNEMVKENHPGFDRALLALIDAFVKNNRLSEALGVLSCMNASCFKPSIGVFNGLMGALVEAKKDFKNVLFVYKELVKVGTLPNVETLNFLLEALFEDGRVDTAMDQYRRMTKKGCNPCSRTFEVLISGLIAKERMEELLVVLDDMFGHGCEVGFNFYNRIISSLCWMNKHLEAMAMFRRMQTSNFSPEVSTYGALIQCSCRNLYMDDAVSLFDEMMDGGVSPDDDIYVDIVNGLCRLNKLTEAKMLLVNNNVDITCPYNVLLAAYCKDGDLVEAKDLFDKMFERNLGNSHSCNLLIRCLCETGRDKKALEVLCKMIVSSFVPNSATCSALVTSKCKQNELADAVSLFRLAKSKTLVLDPASYAELVKCLSQREKIQEAAEVFCYMSSKQVPLQSAAFNLLIKGLCSSGKVDSAIRFLVLAHFSGTSHSSTTYNSIMRGLLKSGKTNDLLVMLSRMIANGCPIGGETYCILVQCMSAANNPKHCANFFNVMLNKGLLPDSATLTSALCCLSRHSQLHMILCAIDKLIFCSNFFESSTYNVLISGMCKEGYRGEACRLLDTMLDKGWIPNAETHRLLLGSVVNEESGIGTRVNENCSSRDEVSSILEEELAQS